ncbi:MAG: prephenate dehydrogenase [Dehalococcoidia bacterium]|nr:prephenate dehydrogenase [Dehalococcoidia bacterium]
MRITIIGLGLIGGSLGLALKRSSMPGLEVTGYLRRPESAEEALRRGAVDRVESDLRAAVEASDLVVLSIPIMAMPGFLPRMSRHLTKGSIVTDTASTKAMVMDWAQKCLPSGVSFVGGHPMAGKEAGGIAAATPDLFDGCTYCLTPGSGTRPEAVKTVTGMVESIGAKPLFIEAERHDYLVAAISHLPLLVAAGLVNVTSSSPDWPDLRKLAASGYRDTTRLASGDYGVNKDIFLSNREAVIDWLDRFIQEMEGYREMLISGGDDIGQVLQKARDARESWRQSRGPLG